MKSNKNLLTYISSNFISYLMSFIMACLVYYFYSYVNNETKIYHIKLDYTLNDSMVVSNSKNRVITVSLKGRREEIESISEDNIRANVDLSGTYIPGIYNKKVSIERTDVNSNYEPISISYFPQHVEVSIDKLEKKELLIVPNITGYPKIGYELKEYSVEPKSVIISGPKSKLSLLNSISTEHISIEGKDSNFSISMSPKLNIPIEDVDIDVSNVLVNFAILESKADKIFKGIEFKVSNLKTNLYYEVLYDKESFVNIKSSKNTIINLLSKDFSLMVDASNIDEAGEFILLCYPITPPNVIVNEYFPHQIRIKVFKR